MSYDDIVNCFKLLNVSWPFLDCFRWLCPIPPAYVCFSKNTAPWFLPNSHACFRVKCLI